MVAHPGTDPAVHGYYTWLHLIMHQTITLMGYIRLLGNGLSD